MFKGATQGTHSRLKCWSNGVGLLLKIQPKRTWAIYSRIFPNMHLEHKVFVMGDDDDSISVEEAQRETEPQSG